MRHTPFFALAAALLAACSGETGNIAKDSVTETPCAGDGIIVSDAWMRPARAGQPTSAAYLTLCNGADTGDALVAASFAGAEATELHITRMSTDGMSSMSHSNKIVVSSGATAMLEPGGAHIMLIGVTDAIEPGDEPLVTLEFKNAPPVNIVFEVREDAPGEHSHH